MNRSKFFRSNFNFEIKHFEDCPKDISEYFTQIYSYKKYGSDCNGDVSQDETWYIPSSEHLYQSSYDFPTLKELSRELNKVKSRLNILPAISWGYHTRNTEPCKEIAKTLKTGEGYDVVTISWIKLQEILYTYPELCPPTGRFNSLHLCEAPGSFIASLSHYLHNNYPKDQVCVLARFKIQMGV